MKQYIVDAFTDSLFHGNQAAVCILEQWLPEETMRSITMENNFSETAFAVREGDRYHLRWFTPGGEIDLCGHATLATGFTLLNHYVPEEDRVVFTTLSGELVVERKGSRYEMEFPAYALREVPVTAEMGEALGTMPARAFMGRDLLCVFEEEETVRTMAPRMDKVARLEGALVHVTAPGRDYDCVSRSFGPKLCIPEDPVCGSGHCHIAPYWAEALKKPELTAYQASQRGGTVYCRVEGEKVFLGGQAVLFSVSQLQL